MPPRATPILILACLPLAASAQTTLVMRAGSPPPAGEVTAVDAQGVTVTLAGPTPTLPANPANKTPPRAPSSTTTIVAWDRVAGIEGSLASAAAPFMPNAERLWRARSRLDRGDVVGAEPLFEELFPAFAGQRGPTAAAATGGLLRCRLGTGAQTAAVAPWLAYINALGDNDQPSLASADPDPTAPAAIDPATGLAPSLPPIWVNLPAVQSLARGPWPMNAGGDVRPRAALLSAYYEQAARFESGLPIQIPTANVERDDAVALVREMVMSRIGDETQRGVARQALSARLKKRIAPWTEAWVRTALGRSMLLESARDTQLLGIAELAELPARLERVNPYLTGIALAEAAVAAAKLGDPAGATALRNELSDRFPGHPALEWEPLRGWSSTAPTPIPNPAPAPPPASNDPTKGGPA
jgi:hypothetical protein